jgi:hypothetical protein
MTPDLRRQHEQHQHQHQQHQHQQSVVEHMKRSRLYGGDGRPADLAAAASLALADMSSEGEDDRGMTVNAADYDDGGAFDVVNVRLGALRKKVDLFHQTTSARRDDRHQ